MAIASPQPSSEAWTIISGNPENPYWQSFAAGIRAACKNHELNCHIQFAQDPSHIADAEILHKAIHAKPLGIIINVPSNKQLSTLLKQATVNPAPLVIASSGHGYFKEMQLQNYVGPNLTSLRSSIHHHVKESELDNTIIISRHNIKDHDHDEFVQSLFENHPNVDTLTPNQLEETLSSNPSRPITLITFGHSSARITEQFLQKHPRWSGKWIAVDGSEASLTANVRISTQPFQQGYRSILAVIKQLEENKKPDAKTLIQEIRLIPKTI